MLATLATCWLVIHDSNMCLALAVGHQVTAHVTPPLSSTMMCLLPTTPLSRAQSSGVHGLLHIFLARKTKYLLSPSDLEVTALGLPCKMSQEPEAVPAIQAVS